MRTCLRVLLKQGRGQGKWQGNGVRAARPCCAGLTMACPRGPGRALADGAELQRWHGTVECSMRWLLLGRASQRRACWRRAP